MKDAAAIVGIGETEFAKRLEESESALAVRAILAALKDAGISPSEVDGLASFTLESSDEAEIARAIGAGNLQYFARVGFGGGAAPATVGLLATAIATGQCQVGVAWRSRKRGSGGRPWANLEAPSLAATWSRPYGLLRPVDEIAMLTRRYLHETGARREHLAGVALAVRRMANRNPRALMYERPLSLEDYLASRWISEPLCLYDNCLESDGALACVVVSAERARDCAKAPVFVHAFAQSLPEQSWPMLNYWCEDPLRGPSWSCAESLYRRSDFGPKDLRVAQIYDAFTPLVLLSLEGYGFCGRGEGPAFSEQALASGGGLAINTSGGGLSEAYLHGMNLVNEGVRQLRDESTNPVANAPACLVTGGEGVPTSALILRR